MANISISALPTGEHGQVNYIVPADTYVMKGDRTWAEPGDHIHGHRSPVSVELSVFTAESCPACVSADEVM